MYIYFIVPMDNHVAFRSTRHQSGDMMGTLETLIHYDLTLAEGIVSFASWILNTQMV